MSSRSDSIAPLRSDRSRTPLAALADLPSLLLRQAITTWHVLRLCRTRARERAQLRSLTRRELRDFCPKGTDAEREMHKPFWRA
jgi:uncharacterized protein YjiS (DUF1127 family)